MRNLLVTIILFFGLSVISFAQTKEISFEKPKVEAKKLSKDGYKILPDALHKMEHQIEIINDKIIAKDEVDGSKKYLLGLGIATETTLSQAKSSARIDAVHEIVIQISAKMKTIIENNGGIQEKGTSLEKLLTIVEEKCAQKMINGPILADFYKEQNGKYIVKRYCAYGYKDAQTMAINYLESELKNESAKLQAALRNHANWE